MAEIDHDAIKEQMVDIIEADSAVYDATGAAGKLALVQVGKPDSVTGFDNIFPSAYITNANPLERISLRGTQTTSSEGLGCLLHQIRYKIVIATDTVSARQAEDELDSLQKLVLEALEADSKLKNGGAALVDSSRPELIETFSLQFDNKPIQGRTITYLVTKAT